MIAIAFACDPKILIFDEPTTALDVTIQGQILDIIKELQREHNTSVIMITHDLGVVANIAQKIAVMYSGMIVERGSCEDIFYRPRHPYTWALIRSAVQSDTGSSTCGLSTSRLSYHAERFSLVDLKGNIVNGL